MDRSKINRRNGNALKISQQLPWSQPPAPVGKGERGRPEEGARAEPGALRGAVAAAGAGRSPPKTPPPHTGGFIIFFSLYFSILFVHGSSWGGGGSPPRGGGGWLRKLRSVCGSRGRGAAGQSRARSRPRAAASPTEHTHTHTHPHTRSHSHTPPPLSSFLIRAAIPYPPGLSLLFFCTEARCPGRQCERGLCKTGQIKMSNIILFDRMIQNDKMPSPEGVKMVNS